MLDADDAKMTAARFAAMADPTRLRILHELARGPLYVGQLAAALGARMVNTSHHLGVMRSAGILVDTKDGRRVRYSLNPDVFTPGDGDGTLGVLDFGLYRVTVSAKKRRPKK